MNDQHFNKIYWYIIIMSIFGFGYIIAITFLNVPEKNIRFADTAQGFILATFLGSGVNYLLGGTPQSKKQTSTSQEGGSIELSATLPKTEEKPLSAENQIANKNSE